MPRVARKYIVSGVYHIILRGNERRKRFIDDEDKTQFLDTLEKMKETGNYEIYAFWLMNNHVHLLLCDTKDEMLRTMKRICVSYIYYFNKKHKKIGPLFQDRYRSEVVEEDTYKIHTPKSIRSWNG